MNHPSEGKAYHELVAENERLRSILRKCMPGTEGVDLGKGEVILGLGQQQAREPK